MYPIAIFGLGPGELIVLLLVVLLIFGATKLPQIGSSLGKGLKNFRKGLKGEDEGDEGDEEDEKPKK